MLNSYSNYVYFCAGLCFLVAFVRLLKLDFFYSIHLPFNHWELGAFLALLIALLSTRKRWTHLALSLLLFVIVLISSWNAPILTACIFGMLHNGIAFLFWIRATQSKAERSVALFCSLLFLVMSSLYFTGWFDSFFVRLAIPFPSALGLDPFIITQVAVFSSAGLIFAILFFELDTIRRFYFSLATAHGYLELAALPLILRGKQG